MVTIYGGNIQRHTVEYRKQNDELGIICWVMLYMLIIIPLGGLGTRFKSAGYKYPKPLINVMGKPIINWLLDNLNLTNIDRVIIPYNAELANFRFEDVLRKTYKHMKFHFVKLDKDTNGAVETINVALNSWMNMNSSGSDGIGGLVGLGDLGGFGVGVNLDDQPILALDGDNFYNEDIIKKWSNDNVYNSVFYFEDTTVDPIYSYLQMAPDIVTKNVPCYGPNCATNYYQNYCHPNNGYPDWNTGNTTNRIIDIREKEKISDYASTGAYGFASYKLLKKYCQKIIDENIQQKGEYYTSGIIKEMLKDNIKFTGKQIDINNYVCLGTPLHVRLFCNNYPRINALNSDIKLKPKRFCFDLDNTLVTFPKISGDYTSVEPIANNINLLRYLKKLGNTIIIYTARRMETHGGNVGRVMADIAKITFDTLDNFKIPYDEIYFGKPLADFYIDDLAVSSYDNLEKELGYYNTMIEARDFNQLKKSNIQIYRKSSSDLSGEIYWYKNIPLEIKDIFPLFLNYDENNTWYDMEKLNAIPLSKLYLSQELNTTHLDHVIGTLKRIHSIPISVTHSDDSSVTPIAVHNFDTNVNIYVNYAMKLKQRYESYDYGKISSEHSATYGYIYDALLKYENGRGGMMGVIHGDPVLTNVLINQFGKIKLIDMRGKLDKLTILGDVFYDWAKIYQSLIGYDEILEDKYIQNEYKVKLINHFKKRFHEHFGGVHNVEVNGIGSINHWKNLQIITASLLFSLIPLHNNNKCIKYYNLMLDLCTQTMTPPYTSNEVMNIKS